MTYTYDANDSLATLLVQLWMDDHWVIDWEGTYFYDVNNDLVISNTNLWRANEWIPYIQRRYTYDNNHFQKSSLFLRFNDDGTAYISGDSTFIILVFCLPRMIRQNLVTYLMYILIQVWENSPLATLKQMR